MESLQQDELASRLIVRQLGTQPYIQVWQDMQAFTDQRGDDTVDEIWLVEHTPVFTQGQAGKAEHILQMSNIPIVQSDRGGQVTYHAPGQQVMYVLIDVKRRKAQDFSVRELVTALEKSVIATLADYQIDSYAKADAPGVYVAERKICSLGLRIRKGRSFHGLALNINMDLTPFHYINPCGYAGLEMCQMQDFIDTRHIKAEIVQHLVTHFANLMGYQQLSYIK